MLLFTHLAVFAMCFVQDMVAVGWVNNVHQRRPGYAAGFTVLCSLAGQWTTIFCVEDHNLIFTTCLGHAVGTLSAIFLLK